MGHHSFSQARHHKSRLSSLGWLDDWVINIQLASFVFTCGGGKVRQGKVEVRVGRRGVEEVGPAPGVDRSPHGVSSPAPDDTSFHRSSGASRSNHFQQGADVLSP